MPARATPHLIEQARSAEQIKLALDHLLADGRAPLAEDPIREALLRIAARFGEIVTQRVNAAPDAHLQFFADLLGTRPGHARAARVQLTFKAAAGRGAAPVVVPMNTRVMAPPAEGDSQPVVYETLDDLELVRAEVVRAVLVDAGHRRSCNLPAMLAADPANPPIAPAVAPPVPGTAVPLGLHIALPEAFGLPGLREIRVCLDLDEAPPGNADAEKVDIAWLVPTSEGEVALALVSDGTAGLTRSGDVVLAAPPAWPAGTVDGVTSLWLTARAARVTPSVAGEPAAFVSRPPRLRGVRLLATAVVAPHPLVLACSDNAPLDISKDAFPFGERPRFGSVFQLLSPALSMPGARVELQVRLTNATGSASGPLPNVSQDGHPVVAWEISTVSGFRAVTAVDATRNLTIDGAVAFTVPDNVAPVRIAGRVAVWLRARLVDGQYGSRIVSGPGGVVMPLAPSIKSVEVRATLERGPLTPLHLVSQGALVRARRDPALPAPVDLFVAPDVDGPVLYLGLLAAPGVLDAGRRLRWLVVPATAAAPAPAAVPRWQVFTAQGWLEASTKDDSLGLREQGIVETTLPQRPGPWVGGLAGPDTATVWLRICWPVDVPVEAAPLRLAINSVGARQSQRLRNEVVGSGSGRAGQICHALRTPIVGDVRLQVREARGDDAGWVDWTEVDDLAAGLPAARIFTLDRSTGAVCFGDGRHGRIPPTGANNIRLAEYLTGGGRHGNRPAGSIVQLAAALPAVESVVNLVPATEGLDADDPSRVRRHASSWLRHRGRAICADDHADLALRSSAEVARAYCVAGRDLEAADSSPAEPQGGVVSVIVVPRGDSGQPQPTRALLAIVKQELDFRRPVAGRLVVVGPTYARIDVRIQLVLRPGWSPHEVAADCALRVEAFLHPVTGGDDARGWSPGQRPHRSDLQALAGAVEGVAFVRAVKLRMDLPADQPVIASAGQIDVSFGEAA